ncbi:MAG: hypothetical protein JWL91_979 [Sphingomonas bacterium]|nr:hypothetical protein [Sphingomonas bacterium]MDB5689103.1 hypothetical protein [Sphingomonas bacterium]
MNDRVLEGLLLTLVGATALGVGFFKQEMPINFGVDTARETNPTGFWALACFYAFAAIAGVGIAARFA